MSDWESILARFRKLGGIADNIILSEGIYGRGLFPINNKLPVRLFVPNDLLLPNDWLELSENHEIKLSENYYWSDEKKAFYLDYLNNFGLTAEVKKDIINQQEAVNRNLS